LRLGAREWLLALGVLTSVALLIAALLDFGDPMARARSEAKSGATARAELVALSWDNLLSSAADPAPSLGPLVIVDAEGLAAWQVERVQAPSERIVELRLDSALFEAAAGDHERAEAVMGDLLKGAPGDPRAAEARLHLARWASGRGDFQAVEAQRALLFGDAEDAHEPSAWVYGISAALLMTLVEPVDPARARQLLAAPLAHLPLPVDRARLVEGSLMIEEDPWWGELRRRLAAVDPAADWDGIFLRELRAGDAVRGFLGENFVAGESTWTVEDRESGLIAARRVGTGIRVLAVDRSGLAQSLRSTMNLGTTEPYQVRFSAEAASPFEEVLPERKLGGGLLRFSVHRDDPLRSGRRDLLQLRIVRVALVILALAILIASIMTARTTERARRLSLLRSTFVASVSHDLRTPIQSMLLMSETLEQNRVATETGRQRYFGSIRREAQRLRRLVEDLLDGARIDRGEGARVERQNVMTEVYFAELEKLMHERAGRADGQLTFVLGGLPETLSIDPDGFHRAVWNLFENALKYGRQPDASAQVTVEIGMEENVLVARVFDEGPGIPARLSETIFSPFERVAKSVDGGAIEKDTGTGLGLSIVRAITRAHGGDTQLEPTPRGARFVATFPTQPSGEPSLAS
jgi:signal transduction histidine kinase